MQTRGAAGEEPWARFLAGYMDDLQEDIAWLAETQGVALLDCRAMEETNATDGAEATPRSSEPTSMQELIEYVAKSLVENPDEVAGHRGVGRLPLRRAPGRGRV